MIQESPLDSLIPAVIPKVTDMIWNSCGPLRARTHVHTHTQTKSDYINTVQKLLNIHFGIYSFVFVFTTALSV